MVGSIRTRARCAAPTGAENDRFLHEHRPQGQFGAGSRRLASPRCRRPSSFAFSAESAADVHGRCVPPVQLRNPEHSEDHRLHDQAPRRLSAAVAATVMDRDLAAAGPQGRRTVTCVRLELRTNACVRCDAGVACVSAGMPAAGEVPVAGFSATEEGDRTRWTAFIAA